MVSEPEQPSVFTEPHGIRQYSRDQKKSGNRIALVPTMVRDLLDHDLFTPA